MFKFKLWQIPESKSQFSLVLRRQNNFGKNKTFMGLSTYSKYVFGSKSEVALLEMIQIYGDIFEKVVPQHPLHFCRKHKIFIFPPNGKLHTF